MEKMTKKKKSFTCIFRYADGVDKLLMLIGFLGAVGDGMGMPAILFLTSKVYNNVGNSASNPIQDFSLSINKITLIFCYMAIGRSIASFLEGYCWTRTAERQASRLRARYLKAVLRQDVAYFDLHVTSTAEVIDSVSCDSLIIQDLLSEKVPVFLMNLSTFICCNVVSFFMAWRLALVAFPLVVFLVIPGLIYGRALMSIARKVRDEYSKAGRIAEQAVSSVRTVYSFVGETKTVSNYSGALEGAFWLGLKQGLAKGLAIGSNGGVTFVIVSFMVYYGSRLVMDHGAQGGSIFATSAAIVTGGVTLGSGLSELRYFSEAIAAAERVLEITERVPEIDLENMEGEVLQNVSGEVEFRHVEFAYPSRPESIILRDFNLRIAARTTTPVA